MAKVSISKAARVAGVARSHLYTKYIKPGKITVERNVSGNKVIDTAELLRVFGVLNPVVENHSEDKDKTPHRGQVKTGEDRGEDSTVVPVLQERIRGLEALLKVKTDALEKAEQEKVQLLGIVEHQTRLLKHQPHPATQPARRTRARILGALLVIVMVALVVYYFGFWLAFTIVPQ